MALTKRATVRGDIATTICDVRERQKATWNSGHVPYEDAADRWQLDGCRFTHAPHTHTLTLWLTTISCVPSRESNTSRPHKFLRLPQSRPESVALSGNPRAQTKLTERELRCRRWRCCFTTKFDFVFVTSIKSNVV